VSQASLTGARANGNFRNNDTNYEGTADGLEIVAFDVADEEQSTQIGVLVMQRAM
jgi:hypothetical protein